MNLIKINHQKTKTRFRLAPGKKYLLRHFFGQILNRNNPSFIRA